MRKGQVDGWLGLGMKCSGGWVVVKDVHSCSIVETLWCICVILRNGTTDDGPGERSFSMNLQGN